jgi:hypothetical protein
MGAGERGWDARLDEHVRGDGWPSTYPYERRIRLKPYRPAQSGGQLLEQSSDWFAPISARPMQLVMEFRVTPGRLTPGIPGREHSERLMIIECEAANEAATHAKRV